MRGAVRWIPQVLSLTLILSLPLSAQKASDFKGSRYHLPTGITNRNYESGKILLKLKPQFRSYFDGPIESDLLKQVNLRSSSRIASDTDITAQNQRRGKPPTIDLSLYRQLFLDPSTDIENAIDALYRLGVIEYAEPSYISRPLKVPDDPDLSLQSYLATIRAQEAWDLSTGSEDIIVAIVDSGVDLDHPDLASIIYTNQADPPGNKTDDDGDGFINNFLGWDFAGDKFEVLKGDNDPTVDDVQNESSRSHGTQVAGCACAIADNGVGVAGVGYRCKVMVLKHAADNDTTDALYGTFLGILYAANHGADIINLSFGGPTRSQFVQDIIEFAVVDQGALVVAAAGNEGNSQPQYPSDYDHVLSVAASTSDDKVASFTSYGNNVDIIAPGAGIYTTAHDDQYGITQGTSFSSPIVSGAAALVKAQYPELTGLQIGEVLRVSADPSIYNEASSQYQKQLGLGRLDILSALTNQPPSIRILGPVLLSADGNLAQAGDQAFLNAQFINHLWPSTSGLSVSISTDNGFVTVLNGAKQLGTLATNQLVELDDQSVAIEIDPTIPENTRVTFLVEFADGAYQDYQFFSVLVNPTFLNVEQNLVSTTVTNIGRLGFQDFDQNDGLGFILNSRNMLFEMGLILGTSSSRISNTVRTDNGETDQDFVQQSKIEGISPGLYSDFEVVGRFNDDDAGDSKSNVLIDYRSMAFSDAPDDHYVIIEYIIANTGSSPLNGFYAGLYADWDIEQVSGNYNDRAGWDGDNNLGYAYSAAEGDPFYAGIQVLSGSPNYWAIDNDQDISNSFGVYDGFTDDEKFRTISSGIGRSEAGFAQEGGNDISHSVGSGPFTIPAGDSITIAFAIHGGANLNELRESAQAADFRYNVVLKAAAPEVENTTICYGADGTLTASGGQTYAWYSAPTGGTPVSTSDQLTIVNLLRDTTLYVANVGSEFESPRASATITVVPKPELTVSGPTDICPGDSVTLTAEGGDSYLWSPSGEASASISVTAPGVYSVVISSSSPSCQVNSEALEITQADLPSAAFDVDRTGELDVQFTDQSTGAVSWFWDFGDGNSSTDQNPSHVYGEDNNYEILLVVNSEAGCTDSLSENLAVLTSLEDELGADNVVIYPNPNSGRFSVRLDLDFGGEVSMGVYNLLGNEIQSSKVIKTSYPLEMGFNIASYPDGLYLLKLRIGKAVIIKRISKN